MDVEFSDKITNATNWYPPYIEDLNGLIVNSGYVKLNDCTTLRRVVNMTINTEDAEHFFENCNSLEEVVNIVISENVTDLSEMFKGCSSLESVSFSENSVLSSVTNFNEMFKNCSSLIEVNIEEVM